MACPGFRQKLFSPQVGRTRLRDDLADVNHLWFPGLLDLALRRLHVAGKDNVVRSRGVEVPAPERGGGGTHASFIQTAAGTLAEFLLTTEDAYNKDGAARVATSFADKARDGRLKVLAET
jgi:hypothetical protein